MTSEKHEGNKEFHEIENRLKRICLKAEEEAKSNLWTVSADFFRESDQAWSRAPDDAELRALKESYDRSRRLFEERHQFHRRVKQQVDQKETLCLEIENRIGDDSEEALAKVKETERIWRQEGRRDIPQEKYELLEKSFRNARDWFYQSREQLAAEERRRQERRQALEQACANAEAALKIEDVEQARNAAAAALEKWNKLEKSSEDTPDEFKDRFKAAEKAFEEREKEFAERIEKEYRQTNEKASSLWLELQELASKEDLRGSVAIARDIQEEFKTLCQHSADIKRSYEKRLARLLKDFNARVKAMKVENDFSRWENYTYKLDLSAKAETLSEKEPSREVFKQLKELRADWKRIGPVPREKSEEVWTRFDQACGEIHLRCVAYFEKLKEEKAGNLEVKRQLLARAIEIKDSRQWKETADIFKELQAKWKETGPAPREHEHELFTRFREACDTFFNARNQYFGELRERQEENRGQKEKLCEEAAALSETQWRQGFDMVKDIRARWKKIPPAARKDERKLWERLNAHFDAFFDRIDAERPANLEKKNQLAESVESILANIDENPDFHAMTKEVELAAAQWKETGPVPMELDQETWNRFDSAMGNFHEAKRKWNEEMRKQRDENMLEKEKLIAEVERVAENNENWIRATDEVKDLQNKWQEIGPAPREMESPLWERFRAACDAFFNNKRGFFEQRKDERQDNLDKKIKLCVRLEKLAGIDAPKDVFEEEDPLDLAKELQFAIESNFASDERRMSREDAAAEVKRIQGHWREIGPVPKEDVELLHKRYRRACDRFFEKRKPR